MKCCKIYLVNYYIAKRKKSINGLPIKKYNYWTECHGKVKKIKLKDLHFPT